MNKEERHAIHLAIVELNWLSTLVHELNNHDIYWVQAKNELHFRGCSISDYDEITEKQKQVDIFGTFANCTLCWNEERGYYIAYGWANDNYNTDLYDWGVGDFRPYYDEKSKKAWKERFKR